MERHTYSVVGSWNNFQCEPMIPDQDTGVWTFGGMVGTNMSEEFRCFYELFHIVLDEDLEYAWYPDHAVATLGECIVQGPDNDGKENYWVIKSPHAGAKFEIKLDFNALDRRKIVTWTWETKPVYDFTGGALNLTLEDSQVVERQEALEGAIQDGRPALEDYEVDE